MTGRQTNVGGRGGGALGETPGTVKPELHACQVELITDVCANVGAAIDDLAALRRAVRATGAGVMGTGTHPAAVEGDAEITDAERYERIRDLLGDAA